MQLPARQTHRHTVVVQDSVLPRHELEVDEMRSGPQHIVGNHSSDQLVLHTAFINLLASQSTASTALLLHACTIATQ